ncbi:MAG: hypothetical protein ACLVJH_15340 [Faecalibacterium prausnitzii]
MSSPASCSPEELGNLPVILTQMQNFIKSNGAQPHRPAGAGGQDWLPAPDPVPEVVHDAAGYPAHHPAWRPATHMDAVLRAKNCLYAHYTGPMSQSQPGLRRSCTSWRLRTSIKLTGDCLHHLSSIRTMTMALIDTFMETK